MATMPVNRVESFTVTAAAGVAKASPTTTLTPFAGGIVTHIAVEIPAGHRYLTGIRLAVGGGQAFPLTFGGWLVGDDDRFAFDVVGQLDSGAWSAVMYNTGQFSHSWYLHYHVLDFHLVEQPAPPELTPVLVLT